jgi:hypothetical protein
MTIFGEANGNWRHGYCGTPTYRIWQGMIRRCEKPYDAGYKYYGGRGITVCKRWHAFKNFLKDMGERPPGQSLERKNNDKGYMPSNCRWATPAEQAANRRFTPRPYRLKFHYLRVK